MKEKAVMLGAYGGRSKNRSTTSLLLSESVVIDAGNLLAPLGRDAKKLDHIFLTHCHLDHIFDLPFLVESFFVERVSPINVYGVEHTIEKLKANIFNNTIWTDFSQVALLNSNESVLNLHIIEPNKTYIADGIKISPFATTHIVPSVGYVVEKNGRKLMFTSDTYKCPAVWEILNSDHAINTLIIETSFPTSMAQLAKASGHLTPGLLNEEIANLDRSNVNICINHFKIEYMNILKLELSNLKYTKKARLLDDGTEILF
ncbi:cAMP phosphodiesterase class-II:metallo-beta-lactamase superfamily protein [Campylobacterota bacterium]|nr:cAMP phosphodiesterase class-II:metallo-beta-lactamase superfamily protein [Campylobacterota bacterium]